MLRFAGYMFVLGLVMKALHMPHIFMTILVVTIGALIYQFVRYVIDLFTQPRYTYNPRATGGRTVSSRYTPEFEDNIILNKRLNRQLFPDGMSSKQFEQAYAMQMFAMHERARRDREVTTPRTNHDELAKYWK